MEKEENKMEKLMDENRKVRINLLRGDVDRIIMALEDSEEDNGYLISQLEKHASEYMGGKIKNKKKYEYYG